MSDNLFNFPDASNLRCELAHMHRAYVEIRIYGKNNIHLYTVGFTSVAYLKCPFRWVGAHFRKASPSESRQFLETLTDKAKRTWTDDGIDLEKHYYDYRTLFLVDLNQGKPQIAIVAGEGFVHKEEEK